MSCLVRYLAPSLLNWKKSKEFCGKFREEELPQKVSTFPKLVRASLRYNPSTLNL